MGGNNRYGRLGHGDEKMRSSPTVTRVAAGGAHSFALFDPKDRPRQNSLFGWGMNHDMQIGHVLTTSTRDRVNATAFVLSPTKVHARDPESNRRLVFKYVVAGQKYSLAVFDDGEPPLKVFGWGSNIQGQLGGTFQQLLAPSSH